LAYFKGLFEHLPVGSEENHGIPQSGYPVPGPRFGTGIALLQSMSVKHWTATTATFGLV